MASRADHRALGQRQVGQVQRAAGPAGQQRGRCGGEDSVRPPGDQRQRRGEQQEAGRRAGLGGPAQLRPVLADPVRELSLGAGRVGYPELHGDPGHVGDVPVAARLVQRLGPEPGVRAQEAVRLRDMHPGQQVRIRGRIGTAVRGGPGDPAMDGPDPLGRRLRVAGPAERGDGEEVAGPLQPSPRVAAVARMRVHARHGQRVQRLEQQGADPAHEHRRVTVHPLDGPVPGEPAVTLGLVDDPAVVRSLGTGHLLEDRRADPAPDGIGGTLHSHLFSITTGICPVSPRAPAQHHHRHLPGIAWARPVSLPGRSCPAVGDGPSRCDTGFVMRFFANLRTNVLSW